MTGARWQAHIGLEIHVQLITASKVFCQCRNAFGDRPNENVCPVCLGYPGILPALNGEAVLKAYVLARSLGCELSPHTVFERKNYFYPDLPKNYQISQYGAPVGRAGSFCSEIDGRRETIGIREVHLEEDAGKMIHAGDVSLLDYNRTGTPLVEVVTRPDLTGAGAAEQFLEQFRRLVRYLRVCDGNMEQGSLRCDANVSVNRPGAGLGNKVEIKNLNSFKFVRNALAFEIKRQSEQLDRGEPVRVETRLWNENRDCTEPMRVKESEDDYRYFPEPDLMPLIVSDEWKEEIQATMAELPAAKRKRFIEQYGLGEYDAGVLTLTQAMADYFEQVAGKSGNAKAAANWVQGELVGALNAAGKSIEESPVGAEQLAELVRLIGDGTLSGKLAKEVFSKMFDSGRSAGEIVEAEGLKQISDQGELRKIIDEILANNQKQVETYRGGKTGVLGFFIGQVMKATRGQADPKVVNKLLREALG